MKYVFPAIFATEADEDGFINVAFPDIIGGVTCGKGMDNAMYMAKDMSKKIFYNLNM